MNNKTQTRKQFFILLSMLFCLLFAIPSCMEMFVPARFRTDYFKQTQLDATMIDDDYQLIQFEGSHYDLGLKMGAAFLELGLDLVEIKPEKKRHYLAQLLTISHYKPEWIDYCRGIAAAYKLPYEEASGKYNLFPIAMNIHFSCSAVFVNSKATAQKDNYMARNFDFPEMKGNLWRTRLKNSYHLIGHDTHFSYPALMDGMNEYGLAVILNAVNDTTKAEKKWSYPLPEYTGIEACYFYQNDFGNM
jgi:predicted choloylglycine hydrolase